MKIKRSSFLIKLIVLILVVYATVTLVSLQSQIQQKRQQASQLNADIAETQQEIGRLQEALDQVDTDDGVEAIARQKLGLVQDGEIVFHDVGN